MANKSKFLKTLLTTASAVAVLTGAANAYGVDVVTNGVGDADMNTGANLRAAGVNLVAGVAANSDMFLAHAKNITVNNGANFGVLNIYGNHNQTANVSVAGGFTNIISDTSATMVARVTAANGGAIAVGGTADAKLNFNITANVIREFNGIDALGNVNLSSANATAKFNNDNSVVKGTIKGGTGNHGVVEVNALNVEFTGEIGNADAIGKFKINDGKSAKLSAHLTANAEVTIGAGSTLTVADGKKIAAAHIKGIANVPAGQGTVEFLGNSVVTTAKLGNTNKLALVKIGAGTVELAVGGADELSAKEIALTADNSVLKLSTANTAVTGDITTAKDGKGKIQVAGTGDTFKGKIGTSGAGGKALEAIEVLGGHTTNFVADAAAPALEINVGKITANAGGAVASFKGDTIALNTNIGDAANPFAAVNIISNVTGAAAATTATLAEGKTIFATDVNLRTAAAAVNNILILKDGTVIKGNVTSTVANNGILQVAGNTTVNKIGNTATIKQLDFTVADKKLILEDGGIVGTNDAVKFSESGILEYTGTGNFAITKKIEVKTDLTSGTGSILVNKSPAGQTVTLTGGVADVATPGNALRLLQVTGGANIILPEHSHILQVDIGTQEASLTLSKANGNYMIGTFSHDEGKGTLIIGADGITLKKGSFAADDKLKAINITGDHTLNIEDGVNFSATAGNGFTATVANNNGTLNFAGASVVDAVVSSGQTLKAININTAGKVVDFMQDVKLGEDVTIANNAAAIFRAKTDVREIKGAGANQGKASFINKAAMETSTKIGATARLAAVEIGGTDIKFKAADFKTDKLEFTNQTIDGGKTTATFEAIPADNFENTVITTTSTNRSHNVMLSTNPAGLNQIFSSAVGTDANRLGYFTITGKHFGDAIEIDTDFYAGVRTANDGYGTVIFSKNNAFSLDLGEKDKALIMVNVAESASVKGDAHFVLMNVEANKKVSLQGVVSSKQNDALVAAYSVALVAAGGGAIPAGSFGIGLDNGATASFAAGSTSDTVINGKLNNGYGAVEFTDNATVTKAIGGKFSVNAIEFKGTGVADISADLNANTIKFGADVTARAADNFILTGATELSKIDLVNKEVVFDSGASKLNGQAQINLTLDADGATIGKIIVDGVGTNLDLNNAAALNLVITDNSSLGDADRSFKLFNISDGATITPAGGAKFKITQKNNRFAAWSYSASDYNLTQKNNTAGVLKDLVTPLKDADLLEDSLSLADAKNTGDAKLFIQDLAKFDDDKKLVEAIARLSTPVKTNTAVISGVVSAGKQDISNRLGALSPTPGMQTADLGSTGMSAGDNAARYGAWVSPFYSQSTQKERKGTAGYKANSSGATIGFDTMANADMTLGAAMSFAKTDIKHKNLKSGDKTKADTYMFSIYGIQQLTNEWFLQAVASFSSSKVKNTETRLTSTGPVKAKGNYDSTTYGGDLMVGYSHKIAEMGTVTPLAGVNFTRISDGSYKETGAGWQNLNITKKAVNKFEGVFGLRAKMNASNVNGIELTPEAYAFVKHDFIGKNPTITAKLDGMVNQFKSKSAKIDKTTYNLGLGLNAKSGVYEYGAGYDLNIANKYLAHQGTLKVRINF